MLFKIEMLVAFYIVHHKSQTHKMLKRMLFILTKHNIRIFDVNPFFKLKKQNKNKKTKKNLDNSQTVKNEI